MTVLRWVAFAVGIVAVWVGMRSVLYTVVVPRRKKMRYSTTVFRLVQGGFNLVVKHLRDYEQRDSLLALVGPLAFLAFLVGWLGLFLVGFALILLPFTATFPEALLESGSSLFTLGIAAFHRPGSAAVYFFEAATGLGTVALLIGYLPTLYSAFNRRETLVTTLQSRAGAPAWGPEILARHELVGLLGALPDLYADWERWAADVAESHTNYPLLIMFRSPHPLRSWIVALLAIMDAAAMQLALTPSQVPPQARLCLRMGFVCLREIADALNIDYDPDPDPEDPIELTFEEFRGGVERLKLVDYPLERSAKEAWPDFRGWRVNYERVAYEIADVVMAAPGPWSGMRSALPGVAFIPQRPVDRRPEDPQRDKPKAKPSEHLA